MTSPVTEFFRNMVRDSRNVEREFHHAKAEHANPDLVESLYNQMTNSWRAIEEFKAHWRGGSKGGGIAD